MRVEVTFTEPLLGTLAGDPKVATEFILSKCPELKTEDENESLGPEEVKVKASTIFARTSDTKEPLLWDYQIKGFLKSACESMINTETMTKEELKKLRLTRYLYKKTIDKQIFVTPRRLILCLPKGCDKKNLDFLERPLRGDTMKGERISLARSEVAPIGTKLTYEIVCLSKKLEPFIGRWLDYGALCGLGQWRTSGMGRFSWSDLKYG